MMVQFVSFLTDKYLSNSYEEDYYDNYLSKSYLLIQVISMPQREDYLKNVGKPQPKSV